MYDVLYVCVAWSWCVGVRCTYIYLYMHNSCGWCYVVFGVRCRVFVADVLVGTLVVNARVVFGCVANHLFIRVLWDCLCVQYAITL